VILAFNRNGSRDYWLLTWFNDAGRIHFCVININLTLTPLTQLLYSYAKLMKHNLGLPKITCLHTRLRYPNKTAIYKQCYLIWSRCSNWHTKNFAFMFCLKLTKLVYLQYFPTYVLLLLLVYYQFCQNGRVVQKKTSANILPYTYKHIQIT